MPDPCVEAAQIPASAGGAISGPGSVPSETAGGEWSKPTYSSSMASSTAEPFAFRLITNASTLATAP